MALYQSRSVTDDRRLTPGGVRTPVRALLVLAELLMLARGGTRPRARADFHAAKQKRKALSLLVLR